MNTFVNAALPLSLMISMLSLGIGLTLNDFKRVLKRPHAFGLGTGAQIVFVPFIAYLLILAFGITSELAVGVMLVSLCPGGVTNNIIAKVAEGDFALSVSLTAVISLLSLLTVLFVAAWSVIHFMGAEAPEVTIKGLALAILSSQYCETSWGWPSNISNPPFQSVLNQLSHSSVWHCSP